MIVYEQFVFASVPRTGGTWFLQACSVAGLGEGAKVHLHEPFPADWSGFKLSMVRNPYDWLVSYYLALEGGHTGIPAVDLFVPIARSADSLDSFLRGYLTSLPGAVGEMFKTYRASSVIRLEDLPWGAIEFFDSLGVPRDKKRRVTDLGYINTRKGVPHYRKPNLYQEVVKAEREYCEMYDY